MNWRSNRFSTVMSYPVPVRKRDDALVPAAFLYDLIAASHSAGLSLVFGSPASPSPLTDPLTGREVLPGTIGLTSISGEVGKLIRLGQWLAENPLRRWLKPDTEPDYQHAFVYVGNGMIIEAEPGGARIMPVTEYSTTYWCMGIAARFTPVDLEIASHSALDLEGVKYSFLDYFALAARRLHLLPLYPLLKAYVRSSKHLICSQLCDAAYRVNGMQIFTDGRWPGDVMPIALYFADQEALSGK